MSSSRPCALCGETDPDRFRIWYDGYIKLYKCGGCGFVAHYPGPGRDTIVEDYEDLGMFGSADEDRQWAHPEWERVHLDTARRIADLAGGGRLLDVGCGDGHLLSHCMEAGFECSGVEYSKARAEYARQATGADIRQGAYSRDLFEEDSFDVIVSAQVLEHIPDPKKALADMHYHLKPGGLLAIEVPSISAPHFLAYRITGIKWFARPQSGVWNQHAGYYTPKTLRRMCSECGFDPIYTHTGRWGLKYHGALGALGRALDPFFALAGIGGILHMARCAGSNPAEIDLEASSS